MTTPRVTEMPRKLEPTSSDPFLAGCADDEPLAVVVQLRPRGPRELRVASTRRRDRRPPFRPSPGSGDDAA